MLFVLADCCPKCGLDNMLYNTAKLSAFENIDWNKMRLHTLALELLDRETITNCNHFIKVEFIALWGHLADHCLETSKPDVDLFRSRGVEGPCLVVLHKFGIICRVAVRLTKDISCLVLALEVEDVNNKASFV